MHRGDQEQNIQLNEMNSFAHVLPERCEQISIHAKHYYRLPMSISRHEAHLFLLPPREHHQERAILKLMGERRLPTTLENRAMKLLDGCGPLLVVGRLVDFVGMSACRHKAHGTDLAVPSCCFRPLPLVNVADISRLSALPTFTSNLAD